MTRDAGFQVRTAEHVAVSYPIAGIGHRVLAAFLDLFFIFAIVVGIVAGFFLAGERPSVPAQLGSALAGLFVVLTFVALPFAYYVLIETFWNGQTLGKRITGIRVLRDDGAPVGFFPILLRNVIRTIDLFPPILAIDLVVMLLSAKGQRLGDLMAGTIVVKAHLERDFRGLRTAATDRAEPSLTTRGLSGEAQRLVREFALRETRLADGARAAVARSIAERIRPLVPEAAQHPDDVAFLRKVAASLRARGEEAGSERA